MNKKTEDIFIAWLKLNEDEKRDFIKEVLHFNNLSPIKQKAVIHQYEKK